MLAKVEYTPPFNLEAEQALLGAILMDNGVLDRVAWFMKPEYFYDSIHQVIYDKAVLLVAAGKVANPITLKAFLPEDTFEGISVLEYLVRLINETVGPAHAKDYASVIAALYYRREILEIGKDVMRDAGEASPETTVSQMLQQVDAAFDEIREGLVFEQERKTLQGEAAGLIQAISDAHKRGEADGIEWPFKSVTEIVSGPMEFGNLYKLIGSPKEGKTSFTLHVVRHALETGHPVLILTFDQKPKQVLLQMACQHEGIQYGKALRGDVNKGQFDLISKEVTSLSGYPLEVERQHSGTKAMDLVRRVRLFAKRHRRSEKRPLIVVDHQQKVTPIRPTDDQGRQASSILQEFKSAAEEHDCAVLMLDQRNSEGSRRINPRPTESDVYGKAGGLQDCDAVLYVYQPWKWCLAQISSAKDANEKEQITKRFLSQLGVAHSSELKDIVEVGVLASRYGPAGERQKLDFDGPHMRFRDPNGGLL